jgi:hypothetical protein
MTGLPPEIAAAACRGWRLLPVVANRKQPLVKEWQKNATTDRAQLEAWSAQFPSCNWGVATGKDSGLFVIDIDGSEGADELEELARQGLTLPETLAVITGRTDGGEHRYYRMPQGVDVHNDQSGRIGPHIDVRGTGGFVVCPPSTHASGKQYRFTDSDAAIVDAPRWVMERLSSRGAVPGARTRQAETEVIGQGRRTPLLVSLAGKLHSLGVPAGGIEAALNGLNETFAPPHPPEKIRKMVDDLTRRYQAGSMPEGQRPDLVCLSDVAPRAVAWLWPVYMPQGMLTMLSGDPGAGEDVYSAFNCSGVYEWADARRRTMRADQCPLSLSRECARRSYPSPLRFVGR